MTVPKLLLISPAFFGYEADIVAAFESHGVEVLYRDERPSNSSVAKALFRIGSPGTGALVARYYRRILEEVAQTSFDTVMVVKGEVVPRWFLEQLRALNPSARFVYYAYDALVPGSNPTKIFDLFDRLYSFDPEDVRRYPGFVLKHLFYSAEFSSRATMEKVYDVSFVGTLHSDRYQFVTALFAPFARTFKFFYVPARWFFAIGRWVTRDFAGVSTAEVSFDKMSRDEVAEVFGSSRAVLDVQRTGQSGLTMRTFEVLAAGAVLVTGNAAVRNADFYDPSRVIVIEDYSDPGAARQLQAQLDSSVTVGHPFPGLERYSVGNWVLDFLKP